MNWQITFDREGEGGTWITIISQRVFGFCENITVDMCPVITLCIGLQNNLKHVTSKNMLQ